MKILGKVAAVSIGGVAVVDLKMVLTSASKSSTVDKSSFYFPIESSRFISPWLSGVTEASKR